MRSGLFPGKFFGIMVFFLLLLEGCGHKGPLKLPAPQTSQTQTPGPQTVESSKPASLSSQQIK